MGWKIEFWDENVIKGIKLKIKIQVMKGMTSGIENICFAFGTKNETVGTENESVGTENHFFLKITCDGTNNQLWNYIDPWFFFLHLKLFQVYFLFYQQYYLNLNSYYIFRSCNAV